MEEISILQDYETEEVEAIVEAQGVSLEKALEIHQEGNFTYYSGVESFEDLAEMFVDEGCFGEIPENLQDYIDYEKIGRELKFNYTQTKNGFLSIA